jgi:mannose/fructose-specific phosphotransferase system component IIA
MDYLLGIDTQADAKTESGLNLTMLLNALRNSTPKRRYEELHRAARKAITQELRRAA